MKILKKYGINILIFIALACGFALLAALTNLLGFLGTKGTDGLLMVFMILAFLIIGFNFGKVAEKNGYLEGIKIGFALLLVLIFINILFYQSSFSLERFIYYTVLILSSIFGSMIGINKKKS